MTVKKQNYTDEFKRQIVALRKSGKSAAKIIMVQEKSRQSFINQEIKKM